jgi:hypothetical protein
MRRFAGPKILKSGLTKFNFPGIDEVKQRFMTTMNSVGCV